MAKEADQAKLRVEFAEMMANAEQRMLLIRNALDESFRTSCRKKGYSEAKGRCDFFLTVRVPDQIKKASAGAMTLTEIVRRYPLTYLASCDWRKEVEVIVADDWPEACRGAAAL